MNSLCYGLALAVNNPISQLYENENCLVFVIGNQENDTNKSINSKCVYG